MLNNTAMRAQGDVAGKNRRSFSIGLVNRPAYTRAIQGLGQNWYLHFQNDDVQPLATVFACLCKAHALALIAEPKLLPAIFLAGLFASDFEAGPVKTLI
jgi:hypothetical protein